MSAEIVRLDVVPSITKKGNNKEKPQRDKDYSKNVRREADTFNTYVQPSEGVIWNGHLTSIHGLHANHPEIHMADKMDRVWGEFISWFHTHVQIDEG